MVLKTVLTYFVFPGNEGEQKRALEKSKALFLLKRYPSTEEKSELLVRGLQMKTVNKWFINYRYKRSIM